MNCLRSSLIVLTSFLAGTTLVRAQQEPESATTTKDPGETKARPFEISHGNLFEALRQMAAYRKLDLLIDPDVPNHKGLYAFKHTTWEKALESLLASQELGAEIKDRILHVGLASRFENGAHPLMVLQERSRPSRTIAITCHPSAEGEPLLSVSVSEASRAEILDAVSKIERLANAKPDKHAFSANWVLRPVKGGSQDGLETFSMEDVTPGGLRALYP
jgi:hypothetical protein